ncbi:hypothetical protein NM897_01875 [Planococcus maritimus]|uniref:hypothetical protein n=1 Tax=Planococcus maritimus TaxID=192421 RepID=UPI0031399A0C
MLWNVNVYYSAYLFLGVSLLIGAFLANELILVSDWAAMLLILSGVFVMNKKQDKRETLIESKE